MTSSAKRTLNQNPIRSSMYVGGSKQPSALSKKYDEERKSIRSPIKLQDENGIDYTPLDLLSDEKKVKEGDRDAVTDNFSQASVNTQSMSSFINTNPVAMTRSKSQQSSSGNTAESDSSTSDDGVDVVSTSIIKPSQSESFHSIHVDELNKPVEILLEETETMFIFDMEPKLFQVESEGSSGIEKRNKEYEVLLNSRAGNDKYVERGMNTFSNPAISKLLQTDKIGHNNVITMATIWDIHDRFMLLAEQEQAERADTKDENIETTASPYVTAVEEKSKVFPNDKPTSNAPSPDLQTTKSGLASRTTTALDKTQEESQSAHSESDLFGTRQSTVTPTSTYDPQAKIEEILNSDNFLYSLFVMERALNMNHYFEKMLYYRDLPYYKDLMNKMKIETSVTEPIQEDKEVEEVPKEVEEDSNISTIAVEEKTTLYSTTQPQLNSLWKFQINFTKGHNVSALAWNKQNPDIIAVAYGQFEYAKQKSGIVCCWSLKNIEFPERIYRVENGATAISWSKTHSNLLAVGMFDGTICVFDVRKSSNDAIVDTKHAKGRHIGPIRQLEWIVRISGRSEEHSEVLISISSDGRVTQWSIRKGFESSDSDFFYDLMKLKRIATRIPIASKQKKTDAIISQYAVGSCFDFNPEDSNLYLAGVEEGHIHKCSCSYNEQYLENYFGHTASVYGLKWSPFQSDVFLSCSADWTIKLWHLERKMPILSIQSTVKGVNAIAWSPKSSVIFACVNESAVEIWNLQLSTLDPIINEIISPESVVLTNVTFTLKGECLLVGDSEGTIHVFSLKNMPEPPKNQAEALDKMIQSCLISQS